jgi:hypothetical protein
MKAKTLKKIIGGLFTKPQRVKIPETELIVWVQPTLNQFKENLPGPWILIAYRLPKEPPE